MSRRWESIFAMFRIEELSWNRLRLLRSTSKAGLQGRANESK